MSSEFLALTDQLYAYLMDTSLREPDVLRRLREETASIPQAGMAISPVQGQFLMLLLKLTGAVDRKSVV